MELASDRAAQLGWQLGENGVNTMSQCQGAGVNELQLQLDAHAWQSTVSKLVLEHGREFSFS